MVKSKYFNLLLSMVLIFSLFSGCAFHTTTKPQGGSKIQYTVVFHDVISTSQQIFIVLSKQSNPLAPSKQPDDPFLFGPGEVVDYEQTNLEDLVEDKTSHDVVVNYYYANYFSTWQDYILIKKDSIPLHYKASATKFPATNNVVAHEQIQAQTVFDYGFSIVGDTLIINFDLSTLNANPNLMNPLYFAIFSISDGKLLVDVQDLADNYIVNQKNEEVFQDDDVDDTVINGLNIKSWKAEIL
jgi:hypothetical protein